MQQCPKFFLQISVNLIVDLMVLMHLRLVKLTEFNEKLEVVAQD